MGWTIVINSGLYTFDLTTKFNLRTLSNLTDTETDSLETLIHLQGVLVGEPPNVPRSATEQFQEIRAIQQSGEPIRVELKLDGVTEYLFDPAASTNGPKIRELVEIPDGANHATHVKFEMSIYVKKAPDNDDDATDIIRNVESEWYNNRLVRVTWTASAKARSLAAARANVQRFKPRIRPLLEQYFQRTRSGEYEARWTWDKAKNSGIILTKESCVVTNSGHPWVVDPRVGKQTAPAFHKARWRPGTWIFTLEVHATDPNLIARPTPHFKESALDHRDRTLETESDLELIDEIRGIWRKTYVEHWYFSDPGRATPNHSTHGDPFPEVSMPSIFGVGPR